MNTMTKVFDVPYAQCFQTEEKWEVSPAEGNADKCLLCAST